MPEPAHEFAGLVSIHAAVGDARLTRQLHINQGLKAAPADTTGRGQMVIELETLEFILQRFKDLVGACRQAARAHADQDLRLFGKEGSSAAGGGPA